MPKILITEPLAEEGISLLRSYAEVDIKLELKSDELIATIGDYQALIVRSQTRVNSKVIEAGEKLEIIARAGIGVDNIDVEAATRRGILVVNAPTSSTITVAEHTIGLMLALARHIPQAHQLLKKGIWRRTEFMGIELRNKTLGIIGLGNIGSAVARRAQGLEMKVIAYDPYVSPEYARRIGVELVSLEELLRTSDFVSLHLPLTEATKGFLGERELRMMKPTAMLINTARGGLVDEVALYNALEEGRLAGAAIDVFSIEPATDNILLKSEKVVVTPHLAASTVEAQANVAIDIAEQVIAALKGEPVRYAVNAPIIPPLQLPFLSPFIPVAQAVGKLAAQLSEGQMLSILIKYEGEIGQYDTTALKAGVLSGLLGMISEERVNIVNADIAAQKRGLKVIEQKGGASEVYPNLITLELSTNVGTTIVAGSSIRGETHIVKVNEFWLDIVPTGGYFLFSDHRDRPGLIGAVGTITGRANINIHSMHLSRLEPRGRALMVLGLDEPLTKEHLEEILKIPDIYTAKLVRL